MTAILQPIGRTFLNGLSAMGRLTLFALVAVRHCLTPPFYPRLLLRQMIEIGYYSLPYVGMTAVFTGMVLVLQSYTGFKVGAEAAMPTIVVISLTRELGPVLGALIVAGRIGASMAAEIGTMRVTEQIDALTTLSTNPDLDQNSIARELGIDRTNVADVLNRLSRRGLIERRRGKVDKRTMLARLTPEGKRVTKEMYLAMQRAQERLLEPLLPAERHGFISTLIRLIDGNNHLGRTIFSPSEA